MSTCECDTVHGGAAGCDEYRELSRRRFMQLAGAAGTAIAVAPAWLPRVAVAKDYRAAQKDVIVSIFLRGASDGLSMVVPYADNAYYTNRTTLAVPRPDSGQANKATDLNGFFGLPPAMLALLPAYQSGNLLFIHASGSKDPSRSHFDAQRFMEVGKAQDLSLTSGWLGRHLATIPPMTPGSLLRAVGMSSGLPRQLSGGPLTLPIPDLDTFGLTGNAGTSAARTTALRDLHGYTTDPVKAAGITTINTIDLLNTINFAGYAPAGGAVYPTGNFGLAMKSAAALIKAQVGVEAIALDINGWDTHNNQGVFVGAMFNLMTSLAQTLAAFHTDMTTGANPTFTLVCMSEFGRRVKENGSLGTDHGHGNCMIVMGNAVQGGRVMAQWPGLTQDKLYQGLDLDVTIDYRDVLSEIIADRLGNAGNLQSIFPGYTPIDRGVTA